MLIPLGTDRTHRRPTVVNHALVALNIAAFVAALLLERSDPELHRRVFETLMLNPEDFKAWAVVSYAFLHGGLAHILGNMVFLWVFGPNVEDRFGRIGYLLFYLIGAGVAGGAHALFYPHHPVIGASGAVAAVTGAYLVLFPHTRIKVLLMFFFIGIYEIPAWWLIGGQIAWNLFAEGLGGGRSGIAYLAHLGGYAWGITLSMILLASGALAREPYDLFSLSRQAARRRQFREVHFQQKRKAEAAAHAAQGGAPPGALAEARAEVSTRIPEDMPGAAAAYRRLLEKHGVAAGAALMSRRLQYELANHLFETGDHQTAATAYQLFLDGYPTDPELPIVRLLLGLINARYLNDPIRARSEITRALPDLPEGHRALARELLAELG
ncbi:MAG: rhomboid family intramembrane serine protease [Phycisphaerales bacterium]